MKFESWNVNGLRACMNKGFLDTFYELDADFFCLQETKLQAGQIQLELPGYEQYWCYAEKKGYSGTAIFTKHTPQSVSYGLGVPELDTEGRLITLEYPEFYLVTCYTPNAQRGLARIEHRLKWEDAFRAYLTELDGKKPVILCGDLNVAHKEIDLKNPSSNRGSAGFSDEERGAFTQLLDCGFTDSFRHLYPDKTGAYSWWSYMFNARANNAGWRIDYFVVSDRLKDTIHDATIHPEYLGSDHCPVGLDLNITCNGGIWSPETERPADKESKEAGGESPAGHILKLSTVIALLAVLALLVAKFILPQAEPTPQTTDPAQTQATPNSLISNVIDRSGTISTVWLTPPGTTSSSYIQQAFTDGDETWVLASPTVGLYPNNFHIQLVFSDSFFFTDTNTPELNYGMRGILGNCYVSHVFYYGENGSISGCFLYGFVSDIVTLDYTISYADLPQQAESIQLVPSDYFGDLSTDQLITEIQDSGKIKNTLFSSQSDALTTLIDTDPYLQELLKRPDAIEKLLDRLETSGGYSSLGSATTLIYHERFSSRMTDAEIERLNTIRANRSDEILYG